MNRRGVVALLGSSAVAVSLTPGCSSDPSFYGEDAVIPPAMSFTAGGDEDRVDLLAFADAASHHHEQLDGDLCWAAGVQMVSSLGGDADVPEQEAIRERHLWTLQRFWKVAGVDVGDDFSLAKLGLPDSVTARASNAASSWEILDALAPGYLERYQGRLVVSLSDATGPRITEGGSHELGIVTALGRGEPVVLSLKESNEFDRHVYVIVGASYRPDPLSIETVSVLDSASDATVKKLAWDETEPRVRFTASRASAAARFEDELDWLASNAHFEPGIYTRTFKGADFGQRLGGSDNVKTYYALSDLISDLAD